MNNNRRSPAEAMPVNPAELLPGTETLTLLETAGYALQVTATAEQQLAERLENHAASAERLASIGSRFRPELDRLHEPYRENEGRITRLEQEKQQCLDEKTAAETAITERDSAMDAERNRQQNARLMGNALHAGQPFWVDLTGKRRDIGEEQITEYYDQQLAASGAGIAWQLRKCGQECEANLSRLNTERDDLVGRRLIAQQAIAEIENRLAPYYERRSDLQAAINEVERRMQQYLERVESLRRTAPTGVELEFSVPQTRPAHEQSDQTPPANDDQTPTIIFMAPVAEPINHGPADLPFSVSDFDIPHAPLRDDIFAKVNPAVVGRVATFTAV